jgi:cell division protein ZapA
VAEVALTIAGRIYRMACGEGEEAHLEELALDLDGRIALLRQSFGEIGDQRLTVMAAITLADERQEALGRIAGLEAEIARLRSASASAEQSTDDRTAAAASAVEEAAARIERILQALDAPGQIDPSQ